MTFLTFFVFQLFLLGTLQTLYFDQILEKIALKTRSRKYPKEKVKKTKNVKNVIIYHMRGPLKNFNHF